MIEMTDTRDKAMELSERMIDFSISIISLTKHLASNVENKIIIHQIIRSATSVGANYSEANNASSKQDFRNKIFIAKKEVAETRYWLDIPQRVNQNIGTSSVRDECLQILMILQKIVSTMKNAQ